MTDLKPCPFCGGAARTYCYRDYWCVLCKCEGEGPPSDHEGGAVAYWNNRAGDPAAQGWRPIESAPKDGREVILAVEFRAGIPRGVLVGHYMEGGHCIEDHPAIAAGWYFWNGAMFDRTAKPTHWMPLPHHPEWEPDGWQARAQGESAPASPPMDRPTQGDMP